MESCGKQRQNKENFLENRLIWQDSVPEYQYPSEDSMIREWAEERHAGATARKATLDAEIGEKGLKIEYRFRKNPLAQEEVVPDGAADQAHVMRANGEELPGQEALKYKMELFLSRDVVGPEVGFTDVIIPGIAYFEKEIRRVIADAPSDHKADVLRENLQLLVGMYDDVLYAIVWSRMSGAKVNKGILNDLETEIEQKRRDAEMLLAANTDEGLDALKRELGLSE